MQWGKRPVGLSQSVGPSHQEQRASWLAKRLRCVRHHMDSYFCHRVNEVCNLCWTVCNEIKEIGLIASMANM